MHTNHRRTVKASPKAKPEGYVIKTHRKDWLRARLLQQLAEDIAVEEASEAEYLAACLARYEHRRGV